MLAYTTASELIDLGDQSVKELTVVADDDGGAVERPDGLLQHVLRCHVEVVGRLVEYQQVYRLQQQLYHGQTAAFAAAEHLHFLVGILAAEHEGPQDVVDAQPDVAFRYVVYRLEHRQRLVQQLSLVLGEVTYLDIVTHLQRAFKGYLVHDALDECGFSFAVLAHEGHLLTTLDGQVYVVEDKVVVLLFHLLADDGIVAASQAGRKLQVHGGVVNLVHLDGHNLRQLLHLLLNLHGLGGLIAEAFDEGLHVGYLFLLVLVSPELLLAPLLAQGDVFVVLHVVVDDPSARDFQGAVRHVVDERAVVAHQHYG